MRFCDRQITHNEYKSANWYKDMKPSEDPAKTLKSHIDQILAFLGRPL
jgi:hypothetical protein